MYRITDIDAWHAHNKAESFLFPNYDEDSATPVINRVLLLDRGDWVLYDKDQAVKFNVMDKDSKGVQTPCRQAWRYGGRTDPHTRQGRGRTLVFPSAAIIRRTAS